MYSLHVPCAEATCAAPHHLHACRSLATLLRWQSSAQVCCTCQQSWQLCSLIECLSRLAKGLLPSDGMPTSLLPAFSCASVSDCVLACKTETLPVQSAQLGLHCYCRSDVHHAVRPSPVMHTRILLFACFMARAAHLVGKARASAGTCSGQARHGTILIGRNMAGKKRLGLSCHLAHRGPSCLCQLIPCLQWLHRSLAL